MEHTISQLAKPHMFHSMIKMFATLPPFPSLRAEFLRAFLFEKTGDRSLSEGYSLVASLLQQGLDTHDEVPVTNETENVTAFRGLQLKVLAGDFFSSRYYQMLAELGDLRMVRTLAEAVCAINQLKVEFYKSVQQVTISSENYLQRIVQFKLPVFQSFKEIIAPANVHSWSELLYHLTCSEVIWTELQSLHKPQHFLYFYVLEHGTSEEKMKLRTHIYESNWYEFLIQKYNPARLLMKQLEEHAQNIEQQLRHFHIPTFKHEWNTFFSAIRQLRTTTNVMS